MRQNNKRSEIQSNAGYSVSWAVLIIYAIIVAYPLFWVILNSLKETAEIYRSNLALPKKWVFSNYIEAWNSGVSNYFFNSLIVTGATVIITVIVSALAAYAMVKFKILKNKYILILFIAGMLISPEVSLIPLYTLIQALSLHDTYWALILPYVAYRIPITVLLIRSYFLTIPRELDDAAYMDGYNDFQIFYLIYLPLSKPIILTVTILTTYYSWNEFLFGIIFIDSDALKTIPAGLMNFRDALQTDWGVLLAGLVISTLPIIILFLAMQKSFIRGISSGSVKG